MLADFLFALSQLWQLRLAPSGRKPQQNRGEWLFSDSSLCEKTQKNKKNKTEKARHSLNSQRILALIPASDLSLTQLYSGGLLGAHPLRPFISRLNPPISPPPPSHILSSQLGCTVLHRSTLELRGRVNRCEWGGVTSDRSVVKEPCAVLHLVLPKFRCLLKINPQKHHPCWLVLWLLSADRIGWGRKEQSASLSCITSNFHLNDYVYYRLVTFMSEPFRWETESRHF